MPSRLLCCLGVMLAVNSVRAASGESLGKRILDVAGQVYSHHRAAYARTQPVRIPWLHGDQPVPGSQNAPKSNIFAFNVVYLAGGKVPALRYADDRRTIVEQWVTWQGRPAPETTYYPYSHDLANGRLFTDVLQPLGQNLERLAPGDLIFIAPRPGTIGGISLIATGARRYGQVQAYRAMDKGVGKIWFSLTGRQFSIRRALPMPVADPPAAKVVQIAGRPILEVQVDDKTLRAVTPQTTGTVAWDVCRIEQLQLGLDVAAYQLRYEETDVNDPANVLEQVAFYVIRQGQLLPALAVTGHHRDKNTRRVRGGCRIELRDVDRDGMPEVRQISLATKTAFTYWLDPQSGRFTRQPPRLAVTP